MRTLIFLSCLAAVASAAPAAGPADEASAGRGASPAVPARIRVLFLGDDGHHQPLDRFLEVEPVLAARGIDLVYTDRTGDLSPGTLGGYECLLIYANLTELAPQEEAALLDYVESGKGLAAIHCASYCFLNSERYVALVGAQFQRHGTGIFSSLVVEPEHPLMRGYRGFESWDETYVHHRHNEKDRTVLEVRPETRSEGPATREPWTWVRAQGKGRVFYTAWGHDDRTWSHRGFHNLLERGLRWAAGADPGVVPAYRQAPEVTAPRKDVKPFSYTEARVPFYPAGRPWGTVGEPQSTMQLPLEPEESLKHMVTPAGFEVRLFAAEPDIVKPLCMSWDARGRLWIAETLDYPNDLQPEGQGNDRIRICEDTDGDGKADRFKVFADRLSLPTSLAFARGGIIVQQPPLTLFLRDRDGDDVVDERQVLFRGWSIGDTHAGPSNLNYGLDNWLWGILGYAGFEGQAGGERLSFRQGFYRFRPDGSRLEFLRNTNNNSWGVGFNEEGVCFGSTANGNPSVHLGIPNRYYEAVRGWSTAVLTGIAGRPLMRPVTDKVRQVDFHGGFTAAAGHALYTARTYPREHWNRTAFVCEPTGHVVAAFEVDPAGAGYRSRHPWNLLASDDEWTAPTMAEVGPDGHVWVIDWYNYIVQHNPTPAGFRTGKGAAYLTDLRDKKHGRILRVVYTGAGAAAGTERPLNLEAASPAELVAALRHPNLLWRRHAQRLLVERGKRDVVPALLELAAETGVDETGLAPGPIHALWTLEGLGALDGSDPAAAAAAVAALRHPSTGVRRNAALVLPRGAAGTKPLLESGVLRDPEPQVRLAALLSLAERPGSEEAGEALAAALEEPRNARDRWLQEALTCAAAAHDLPVLKALLRRRSSPAVRRAALQVIERVGEHHARGAPAGTLAGLLQTLEETPADGALKAALVAGLARGWPREARAQLGPVEEERLLRLFQALPAGSQGQVVSLAARWGSQALAEHARQIAVSLLARVRDEEAGDRARLEAASRLMELSRSDPEAPRQLLEVAGPRAAPELARGVLQALRSSEVPATGQALVEHLPSLTPAVRADALRILLERGEWTRALLKGFEEGTVHLTELSLDQKQALAQHPDAGIAGEARKLLAKESGLPSPDRQKVLEELMPLARRQGDAARGQAVFQKQCTKCHVHGEEGKRIGPDLTGVAVHPKADLLAEIIDPNRSVEGTYRVYTAVTREGRVLSGLLSSESRTALELVDTDANKHAVLREDLTQLVASSRSLMPDGFEKQVSPEELVDLLEFLTRRGKYLSIPLAKAATVTTARGMFYSEEARGERIVFPDWSPKTFAGVPFHLVDPDGGRTRNAVLLHGPQGTIPPRMPRSVRLLVNSPARAVHFLGGVSGWGYPNGAKGSVSMIVRLHYQDGATEDHPLRNGEHLADYNSSEEVPGSQLAFRLRGRQVRYLAVRPAKAEVVREIELLKGEDSTAPVVLAVTVETE